MARQQRRTRWLLPPAAGALLALALAACGDLATTATHHHRPDNEGTPYLFCFWNVENLFDDVNDHRKTKGDEEYDALFGSDAEALSFKLKHLADVLMKMNDGRGPDILGVAEVESERAAQLLADALNKRLGEKRKKKEDEYRVVFENLGSGRHISPALLTRLPVVRDKTDRWGKRQRILKTVVRVNDRDLVVVVSHWTSRVSDERGAGRGKYADAIYGNFKAAYLADAKVDLLVCGDFNDNPDDRSVKEHLHAVGDLKAVKASGRDEPLLFDLLAKSYEEGKSTVEPHGKRTALFDHICASPGMFDDSGWSCDPDSARIVTTSADRKGRPTRFGGKHDKRPYEARGPSDHFPVTVTLRVR
jgi:endonuclease/exonuclease/phosphatase family metal-dependent hydrolase